MAANFRIMYDCAFDAATITSSSEEGALIDDNVVDDFISKVWRSTGTADQWLKFDLGSATTISGIGIFGHNFTANATVMVLATSADGFPTVGVANSTPGWSTTFTIETDSDSVVIDKSVVFFAQKYRWWQVTMQDNANTDGYMEVGRVMGGDYWESANNFRYDYEKRYADPSFRDESEGQQLYVKARTKYWSYMLAWSYMTQADQDQIETIFRNIGRQEPCMVALDPDDYPTIETVYAWLNSDVQYRKDRTGNATYSATFRERP